MTAKTVLITGANKGIGLGLAQQFKKAGYKVFGTARKPQEATELASLADKVFQLDVSSEESIKALSKELNDQTIDVLVNNAGIAVSRNLETLNWQDCIDEYKTNALGPLFVTVNLMKNLEKSPNPAVVCISSTLGSIGENTSGQFYGYRASKSAVNQNIMSLTHQFPKIKFVTMCPGYVSTDLNNHSGHLSVEVSTNGLLKVIDKVLSGEEKSGQFINHQGNHIQW